MYDLVVCGAGAVGSYLASLFAKKHRVALIEENSLIGKPLACSGLYSKRLLEFIDPPKELIENEITGANIHAGGRTFVFSRGRTEAYVIRRDGLDAFLVGEAEKNGSDVLTSHRLTGYAVNGNISIELHSEGKTKEIEAKTLAGCDGPRSIVRKTAGLKDPKETLQGIFCYADEEDDSSFVDLWFGLVPGFFAWRIPRGHTVEYGIAAKDNARALFQKFIREREVKIKGMYGGLIPIGPPKRIVSQGVFLCGDSAAMTKPFTGGGIIYGFTSANVAFDTIEPGDQRSLEQYQKEWKRKLRKEIKMGLLMKSAYSFPPFIQRLALSLLERRQGKLDMDMPSSVFS